LRCLITFDTHIFAESIGEHSNSLLEELADWNRQLKGISELSDELKGVVSNKGNPPCLTP
jgi:hypothetical protein